MATIFVYAPSGQTLTVDLINRATGTATVSALALTETPAGSGIYKGTTSPADGIYQASVKAGGTVIASNGYARVNGTVDIEVGDGSGVHDGIKLDKSITADHDTTTDTLPMTLSEN